MKDISNTNEARVIATPVCLSRTLIKALDNQAEQDGVFSRSAIIRRACNEYLERRKREDKLQEAA